jgi:hypothetical protein
MQEPNEAITSSTEAMEKPKKTPKMHNFEAMKSHQKVQTKPGIPQVSITPNYATITPNYATITPNYGTDPKKPDKTYIFPRQIFSRKSVNFHKNPQELVSSELRES